MNPEKQTPRSSESLNRKQKLLRRAVPITLLLGAGGAVGIDRLNDADDSHEAHGFAMNAKVAAQASGKFGGSESDWGNGTAEDLIRKAVHEGAAHALANISTGTEQGGAADYDLQAIIDALPVYDQANQALEMADYTSVTPDKGDLLAVSVAVNTEWNGDSKPVVTYEVTDAKIEDIENNQQ